MEKCIICGKEITGRRKSSITCSEECRTERNRRTSKEYHSQRYTKKEQAKAFFMECPWKSGLLPECITRNQIWS